MDICNIIVVFFQSSLRDFGVAFISVFFYRLFRNFARLQKLRHQFLFSRIVGLSIQNSPFQLQQKQGGKIQPTGMGLAYDKIVK